MATFINNNFIPVRLHVKKHPEAMPRFSVDWTPTVLIVDSDGKELYRIEGYLPPDEFLGQLQLGFGHAQFTKKNFADAERQFRDVCEKLPGTDAAAEATYWAELPRAAYSGQVQMNRGERLGRLADAIAADRGRSFAVPPV